MQPRSISPRAPALAAYAREIPPARVPDWRRVLVWGGIVALPWTLVLLIQWLLAR